jgi:hypothetical protein
MTHHWSAGIPALIEAGSPEPRRLPPIRGIFHHRCEQLPMVTQASRLFSLFIGAATVA